MIQGVQSYTTSNSKNKSSGFTNQKQSSKIAFKGQQFPSGYYEDDEIEDAKKYMHEIGDSWKKRLKDEKYWKLQKEWSDLPFIGKVLAYLFYGPASSLIINQEMKDGAKTHVEKVVKLIPDLLKKAR